MRTLAALLAMLAFVPLAEAADVAAGKAKAAQVCGACHGVNGVSVSPAIPNLAGQKSGYLANQLKDFKAGKRKNDIMNPIAGQLAAADIDNVAAYFASLQGAAEGTAVSDMMPNIKKTNVAFPADYKTSFKKYMTIDFPDRKQVRYYFANEPALKAAREGKPIPDGAYLFVEVHTAKLDDQQNPVKGSDGHIVADKPAFYTAMARQAGWGKDIPDILRNEDWNYAAFNLDMSLRPFNHAECLACHKPLPADSYLFTLKDLRQEAMKK